MQKLKRALEIVILFGFLVGVGLIGFYKKLLRDMRIELEDKEFLQSMHEKSGARAIRVTERSLELIADVNYGQRPDVLRTITYFVLPDNPHDPPQIMSWVDFFENYQFIGPESDTHFVEVNKISDIWK